MRNAREVQAEWGVPGAFLRAWGLRVLASAILVVALAPLIIIASAPPTRTFDLDRIHARLRAIDSLRNQRIGVSDSMPLAHQTNVPAAPVYDAPRDTTRDAARDTARDAARDAALGSVREATRDHQRDALRDSLRTALRQLGAAQPILPRRRGSPATTRPWNALAPDAGMFQGLRSAQYRGPNPSMIISRARAGFTTAERSYLGVMAQAPLWADFERLARLSPHVGLLVPLDEGTRGSADDLGGRDLTGTGAHDTARGLVPLPPLLAFGEARQLAIASIYRAAWMLARHDSIGAERTLRHALTVGFALIDVGTSAVDALAGATLIDLARDGLQQLHSPDSPAATINRTALTRTRTSFVESMLTQAPATPTRQLRHELADAVADSTLPRVLRLQALQSLVLTTCDQLRTVLLGPDDTIRGAARAARQTLSQAPADHGFFDAIDATLLMGPSSSRLIAPPVAALPGRPPSATSSASPSLTDQFIGRAGALLAWATRTPRIARCTDRALQPR